MEELELKRTKIKKLLYLQKPEADLQYIQNNEAIYIAEVRIDTDIPTTKKLIFTVPVSDMGNTRYTAKEDAKLLIRFLDDSNLLSDI